jgi:Protein of unknown function DUF262/Protein of unknown function (DUF1524)
MPIPAINLKKINDLRIDPETKQPRRFRVPSYQRGYRWSAEEVTQLLDDVLEFKLRKNPQQDEFYCLQPLVLLPCDARDDYEVVDGQQRLTTALLLLRFFNTWASQRGQLPPYQLTYDTRADLGAFLNAPDEEAALKDINIYHVWQAIQAIETWFEGRDHEVESIKDCFLNHTKVIWYELSPNEKPIAAFTRLNIGKIALTNAELIRGLFLRQPKEGQAESLQLRIAYEWDLMEKSLQRSDFWYYLRNDPAPDGNRIDSLFTIVALLKGQTLPRHDYAVFTVFSKLLSDPKSSLENEWLEVRRVFMLLEEWFDDRRLYHLVGFLVKERQPVHSLIQMASGVTKAKFQDLLLDHCFKRICGTLSRPLGAALKESIETQLDGLRYGSTKDETAIHSALLLFNIASLLQNSKSNLRFQFDSFKETPWDIEHVRSQAAIPEREGERRLWLKDCLEHLLSLSSAEARQHPSASLIKRIQLYLESTDATADKPVFDDLYQEVRAHFKEDDDDETSEVHSISNLALLDQSTNRSYKNAVFAVKRRRVLDLDRHGVFIPLCTRNVFLKCYNNDANNLMFWSETDRESYRCALVSMLCEFFAGGPATHE